MIFYRHATLVFFLLTCLGAAGLHAQNNGTVRGTVTDTTSKAVLSDATIYVLRAKDSVICSYGYTKPDGSFSVGKLPAGKLILLASYPEYADYAETFTLDEANPVHDFGPIDLRLKSRLLQEVIISGKVTAVRIKGDTTEFNAKAYTIQPNDKVEDLLRQLPGLQVDREGKITANGERVTKVLVDGEEFFGDDPTLVTRNVRAEMVDKVQLYDKKSDQATFTGVDDGIRTKTLNVKLREDKNSGIFGKLEALTASNGRYGSQGLFNKFKPGERFATYATAATNGRTGLGNGDNNRIGAGGNNALLADVVALPSMGPDELEGFDGRYNGRGLPDARTAGVHYDAKMKDDKETINANYKANYISVNSVNTLLTDRNVPGALLSSSSSRNSLNDAFRQKLDATYTTRLDSTANLKVALEGSLRNSNANSSNRSLNRESDRLLSGATNVLNVESSLSAFAGNAFYSKRLKKSGRTFSWSLGASSTSNRSEGLQLSQLDFYNAAGGTDSTQRIDQQRNVSLQSTGLSSNMTVSESLSKKIALVMNYGIAYLHNAADRRTLKPSSPGVYDQVDPLFSNDYRFSQFIQQAGAVFTFHQGNTTLSGGTRTSFVDYRQLNLNTSGRYFRSFINWTPQLSYQLRISRQKNFSAGYNGNSVQPGIDQLQPVRENADPFNIVSGNPGLTPSFSHRLNVSYRSYSALNGTSFGIRGTYGLNSNAIVFNSMTENNGRTTTRYTNLDGRMPVAYNLSTNLGFKIKPLGLDAEIELFVNGSDSYSYTNGELNKTISRTYWSSLLLQKTVQRKYNFQTVIGPNYTVNRFSLRQVNNDAAGFYFTGYGSVYLLPKVQLGGDFSYNYTGATRTLPSQDQLICNATLSRTFLKGDGLKLSFSGNDLLNQNLNFSRTAAAGILTQSSFNNIRRNFAVSLSWDFSKFGAAPLKN